ncbi:hypothetical protein [Streptomyces parvulus]|uniref:hypothetical protein n=1 Tax=Streptomyces parvulus TaxID=146923 RepID=UPI003EC141DE
MAHTTHIAPVTLGTNGHLPFVVRAAEAAAARADQAAAESADRYIAREFPAVAELLAEAVPLALARTGINLGAEATAKLIEDTTRGLTAAAAAKAAGACQYRDCEDTEPGHFDHFAHSPQGLKVKDENGPDGVIIDAGMAACSGTDPAPVVYLRNWEATNMAELEAKVAEIRRMLDATLEFGARVFADGAQA